MTYTLTRTRWDGVAKQGEVWVLGDGTRDVKTWNWLPLPWVRLSCLVHGYGWPRVNR